MADNFDSPWKEAISSCLPEFIAFHFPDVHAQIDWAQPVDFLEQELLSVAQDHGPQSSFVDKLVRVTRLDGRAEWVVIHLEIQCQQQAEFAERMFLSHARLFERHRQPIASLALLADDRADWRPESFDQEVFGCQLRLRFPVTKLLDWTGREERLADSRNPFAILTRAHLATRATRKNPAAREREKIRLVRDLYRSGLDRQRIVDLFRVIDWMMKLPKENDGRFRQTVVMLEEDLRMRYVTSIERLAIEEGMAKGIQEGLLRGQARAIARQLAQRFGELPSWVHEKLKSATPAELDAWVDAILEAESIEGAIGEKMQH